MMSTSATSSAVVTEESSTRVRVGTILGTMTFGWRYSSSTCDDEASTQMMRAFAAEGFHEVDTALAYAGGETERIIGRALASDPALNAAVRVDTKANPWPGGVMTPQAGRGGLAPTELRSQVESSTASLGDGVKIRVLYLHAPDADTRLEDVLGECEQMRTSGLFEEIGLSNFSAWETVEAHRICERNGWKAPTIYQGMYNALTRNVEFELLPALRATGMRFAAYNPLCGGLLTGKYKTRDVSTVTGGRFDGNDMYTSRFWLECYHTAVDNIVEACSKHNINAADASLRWLYNHSELDGAKGDAVIIGASSVSQLESNVASAKRTDPLPKDVLNAMDLGWRECENASAPYFRGHCKI